MRGGWVRWMGGGGVKIGNVTTSQTRGMRGTRGDGVMIGDGATRGTGAGRGGLRRGNVTTRQTGGPLLMRGDGATRGGGAG